MAHRVYNNETSFATHSSSNLKTFFTFFFISLLVFVGAVYLIPHGPDLPPPTFCMNPLQMTGDDPNQEIWAPDFCIVSNPFDLSSSSSDQDQDQESYVKPPIIAVKALKVSTDFLLKEADQVWSIKMSIENPNLGMNVSYNRGTVNVMYGTKKLGTRYMIKEFRQASWGHRSTSWTFNSNALAFGPAANNIRHDVATKSSAVFRVMMEAIIRVYPSSTFSSIKGKRYMMFADCDGLKVDFPSGTMGSGGTGTCQVELQELKDGDNVGALKFAA